MNELMKYGAYAVGGYVLYNWLKNASFMQPTYQSLPLASNIAPNVTGANNITNVTSDVRSKMLNEMQSGGGNDVSDYVSWAGLYHRVTGNYAPAYPDSNMGRNGISVNTAITLDQFLATARLNGMSGTSGLGFLTLPSYAERNLVR